MIFGVGCVAGVAMRRAARQSRSALLSGAAVRQQDDAYAPLAAAHSLRFQTPWDGAASVVPTAARGLTARLNSAPTRPSLSILEPFGLAGARVRASLLPGRPQQFGDAGELNQALDLG